MFTFDGRSFTIPGYMVWGALVYAVGGSWLAWRGGRPLIALNAERYAREAELRFGLVRINEHAEGIALHGGERDERLALNGAVITSSGSWSGWPTIWRGSPGSLRGMAGSRLSSRSWSPPPAISAAICRSAG